MSERVRPELPGFGDRARFESLVALRSRSFAARIHGESREGEPASGRWLALGGAHAIDWRGYRCVQGFDEAALQRLDELLDWFEEGPVPTFETFCGEGLASTAEALCLLGYRPFHAHAFFAAALRELPVATATAMLELSEDPREFGRLGARVWHEGDPERADALARQHEGPQWSCLTVVEAGRAVATTSLFLDGAHAYHANALTLPEARGRGLHVALLRAHVELARARGKTWFVADTQVGSTSGRNLERVGLRCVATSLVWMPRT